MKIIKSIIAILFLLSVVGCSDFLEVNPKGVLSEEQVSKPELIDNFVVAAYATMPGLGFGTTHAPWIQSVRSDDAYKGGGGLSDQTPWYEMEIFTAVTPNIGNNDAPWYLGYVAVSRCNTAIRLLNEIDPAVYEMKDSRIAEMKFIRSWIYLGMKLRWKYIPFMDETVPNDAVVVEGMSNRPDSMKNDLGIWDRIIKDFEDAAKVLPDIQTDKGRPTKYAAHAFAAKALLFRAYEQNDQHKVVNINKQTLQRALDHINTIMTKDKSQFDLEPDFANNFLPEFDNNTKESLWEVQYSIDDGTTDGRINRGDELNAPWWSPYFSCCDFHKVSYTMINAFKTDKTGVPDFENYNQTEFKGSKYKEYFTQHSFDPRLGHTAAIPGYPWKYNNAILYQEAGSRAPFQYGYFNSMKEQVDPNCNCLFKPFYIYNSMNKKEIRYAEVLLWKAEILMEQGQLQESLNLVNRIRARAATSLARLKKPDGTLWMDYKIQEYKPGVNFTLNKENLKKAIIWENRLEFANEGRRFFDLLRWGLLPETMNAFINKEKGRFDWYNQGRFVSGRDEYLPIPQQQMNWSKGSYKQNPGY